MSTIVNATAPLSAVENAAGGLDIQGFEDQVNRLNGSDSNDLIIGGEEDDILAGLGGNDTIEGLGGDDILIGGSDADTLIGGEGSDHFIFDREWIFAADEIDQLPDFDPTEDSLGIVGLQQGDNVDYNRDSGVLSLNGQAFAQIGRELPLGDNQLDFDDLIFDGSGIFGSVDAGDDGDDSDDGIEDGDGGDFVGTDGVEDVFAFNRDEALDAGEIIPIEGFEPGVDTLQINGIVSGDSIGLDRSTGIIRINSQPFAQIDPDVAQDIKKNRDFDLL